jgi:hypothetical protein
MANGKSRGETGVNPAWSHDGQELFFWSFRAPRNQLMVASYKVLGDSFVADEPRVWSEKRQATFTSTRSYDAAPDGKRVVTLMPAEPPQEPPGHLIFLLNFFDELRRRASAEPRYVDVPGMEIGTQNRYAFNILLDFPPKESPGSRGNHAPSSAPRTTREGAPTWCAGKACEIAAQ